MKSLLCLTLAALIALFGVVNAGPSCRLEIKKYTYKNIVCAERGIDVQSLASKLVQGDITYDEIVEKVASECESANSAKCYNDISTPIEGHCNEVESIQHFRNAFKTVLTFNEYMCQNNGQTYLEFIKDGGAECYYNEEKARCYTERKDLANVGELSFTDENVCEVLNADWECLHFLDDCENKNVATYYRQILISLREKFSC